MKYFLHQFILLSVWRALLSIDLRRNLLEWNLQLFRLEREALTLEILFGNQIAESPRLWVSQLRQLSSANSDGAWTMILFKSEESELFARLSEDQTITRPREPPVGRMPSV
jgi:hypothetical protein